MRCAVWIVFLASCGSTTKPDLSAVDDCAPGMPDRPCSISAMSPTRQGGLVSIGRRYEESKTRGMLVHDFTVRFTTEYEDVASFMVKQVGSPAIHTHEIPGLEFPGADATYDVWVTSDGTWALSRESMKLDWYSLPFVGDRSDKSIAAATEQPAPVS